MKEGGGINYFSAFNSRRINSLTKSAADVYSGCFFRYPSICSYSGSGRESWWYPLTMVEVYTKYNVKVFIEISITFSRKIYIKFLHYSKYGRKERCKNERV